MPKWTVTYGRGSAGQQEIEADRVRLTGQQDQWVDFMKERSDGGEDLIHRIAADAVHEVVRAADERGS